MTAAGDRKLKVLLVPGPPPAGAPIENGMDKYLDSLVRGMGDRVEYVCLEDPQYARGPEKLWEAKPAPDGASAAGQSTRALLSPLRLAAGYWRDAQRLAGLMRPFRGRVDLVHVNRVGCETQSLAARLAGFRPVVTTIHNLPGEDPAAQDWLRKLIERVSFMCGDLHMAVSEATYEAWHKRIGLARSKVVRVYNGMEPEDLTGFDRTAFRRQFCDRPEDTLLFGICARLHRMKGHVVLLAAWAKLLHQSSETRGQGAAGRDQRSGMASQEPGARSQGLMLLIAGEGPERGRIEAAIRALGIGDHVKLLGHRQDAFRFLSALDVHVLPSITLETIGYSVIEAMFAGVPSVVSDVGGMKEIISASGGGTIVPRNDAAALFDALRFYAADPDARRTAGARARSYAVETLTGREMASRTEHVYRRALQGRATPDAAAGIRDPNLQRH